MSLLEAKQALVNTRPATALKTVTSAISTIADHLNKSYLNHDLYADIVRALVDRVAERLSISITQVSETTIRQFESIFLTGDPTVAFTELTNGLKSPGGVEILARTLVLFVDDRNGGAERLSQILSNAEIPEIVSALIHLPSRIINILRQADTSGRDIPEIINETAYISTLSDTIYQQASTPDPQRDHLLSELLRRLVTIGHSNTIITQWLSHRDEARFLPAFLRAPQHTMPDLLRLLLDARAADEAADARITRHACSILNSNASALDACMHLIPLERPLFQRPKHALRRLVHSVSAHGRHAARRALLAAAELWSTERFAVRTDVLLQRQVTRLVLLYLRVVAGGQGRDVEIGGDEVMMTLVHGVHHRLGENDERVRRHGMVVGEASSRYCAEGTLLRFDRSGLAERRKNEREIVGEDGMEDGGDSDFSELADCVGRSVEEEVGEKAIGTVVNVDRSEGGDDREELFWETDGPDRDWQREDDWSSISSYASTGVEGWDREAGHDVEDVEALREKLSALDSIPRMISFLRGQNNRNEAQDHEALTRALKVMSARAEGAGNAGRGTLVDAAPELLLEILRVDADRLPEVEGEIVREARWKAAISVCRVNVGYCVDRLLECVVCGGGGDVARRAEGLRVMTESIRGHMSESGVASERNEGKSGSGSTGSVGKVTKMLSRSLAVSKERLEMKADRRTLGENDIVVRSFQRLATFLTASRECQADGAQFLQLEGADSALWAQGLLGLCVLATNMGGGNGDGRECRRAVAEVAMGRIYGVGKCEDVIVRRAVALTIGGLEAGMDEYEIGDELGGDIMVGECERESGLRKGMKWLVEIESGSGADGDVAVRRFAGLALSKWAKRMEHIYK